MKLPNQTILLLVTLLAFTPTSHAADPTNTPPKAAAPPLSDKRLKEVNWDGLPLSEIVRVLRDQFREINFVVARNVQSESVSLILREVSLDELFKALEFASEGRIRVTWNQLDRLVMFEKPPTTSPTGLPDPAICRVFNLTPYLGNKVGNDVDTALQSVTEALQEGWRMLREANNDQSESTPKLSFHRGANLLIVVARPFEMTVANEVIKELQGSTSATTIPVPREHDTDKSQKRKPAPPDKP